MPNIPNSPISFADKIVPSSLLRPLRVHKLQDIMRCYCIQIRQTKLI